ncbi:unnamed protein product [Mytilus edulis]|uniref:Uncharacterized protein n=1 Tax=Mytilus edulis TaxID=6550 RepID=A0A8S3TGY8_MYTED|nr:unnamed protein product [Mytilus edulis]
MEPIMQEQYFGKRSFNCNVCRKTCHKNCWVPFDLLKRTCEVIEDKKCTVCQGKCGLSNHSLSEYVFVQQYVKSWYSGKDVISRQKKKGNDFFRFQETLAETGDLIKDLNDNALEPDVLTLSEYIENIITKEKDENKIDFQMRVQILKKVLEHLKKERSVRGLKMEDLS